MDLSQISTEDLQAIKAGDLSKVSNEGLVRLRYQQDLAKIEAPKPVEKTGVMGAIGAGFSSVADRLSNGIIQALSSDKNVQRGLKVIDKQDKARDAEIRKDHPFAFGIGESLPLMAVPGGQATVAGRIAAPAIGNAVLEGMSYGTPGQRMKNAAEGAVIGAVGGTVGEGLGRLIRPMRGAGTVPDEAIQAAGRLGIPLSAGQRTGSRLLNKVEDTLYQTPGAGSVIQRNVDAQKTAINRAAARSAGLPGDVVDQKYLASARAASQAERAGLEAGAKVSPVDVDLLSAISKAQRNLSGMQQGPKSLINDAPATKILDDFTNFVTTAQGPMDGQTYQAWKTLLTNAKKSAYKADDSATGEIYGDLLAGLNKAAQKGNSSAWKRSDIKFATLDLLEQPNVVNEVTGNVNPRALAAAFNRKYGAAAKEGRLAGELQDIASFAKGFPELREGSQTAGRAFMGGLLGGAGLAAPVTTASILGGSLLGSKMVTTPGGVRYLTEGLGSAPVQRVLLEQAQRAGTVGGVGALSGLGISASR